MTAGVLTKGLRQKTPRKQEEALSSNVDESFCPIAVLILGQLKCSVYRYLGDFGLALQAVKNFLTSPAKAEKF